MVWFAGVCKACSGKDIASAGRLGEYQERFAHDLDPMLPSAPQTLGDMTEKLKVYALCSNASHSSRLKAHRIVCRGWAGLAGHAGVYD